MPGPSARSAADPSPPRAEGRDDLFELAIDFAEVGLWDLDPATGALFWPPRVKAMFGISPDVAVTIADFDAGLHPDDRDAVLFEFEASQNPALRTVYEVEYRTIGREDGVVRWLAAKGRGVFDAEGRCTRVLGTVVDITRRKQAEAQHRESEERLQLLDRIGEATRALNDAGDVMQVATQMMGEHLRATRCAYADVEPDGDRFTIRNDWALPGVPSSVGVYSLGLFGPLAVQLLPKGRHLIVNDVDRELGDEGGAAMFNAIGVKAIICAGLVKNGRLVALMAVHQSVPRTWTDHEIRIVAEVVDRCWAHIERVRDAATLRDQDRRKDEFIATLAHELRNPVAPLRYAAALLARDGELPRQRRAREVIERQTGHLARLIDDLLDISRINRGLVELKKDVVAVAPLLHQAVEAARPAIERARHRLTFEAPGTEARIEADPARIVQVVTNLLDNAAKYTPDGGEIGLSARLDGERLFIEVADNGIGIAPEDQGKLFQRFSQLPQSGHKAQGGLGIGLSLVRQLVDMHAGQVRVASAGVDQGSTFTIELPCCHGPLPVEVSLPAPSQHVGRVLVVEDNRDGLETLLALLETAGHEVRGAASGEQAFQVVTQWLPQLVLLDLGLPHMDGCEVAARLRADPRLRHTRLVALTGWGAERDRERTRAAGFDAHLTKPIDPDALLRLLGDWLPGAAPG